MKNLVHQSGQEDLIFHKFSYRTKDLAYIMRTDISVQCPSIIIDRIIKGFVENIERIYCILSFTRFDRLIMSVVIYQSIIVMLA